MEEAVATGKPGFQQGWFILTEKRPRDSLDSHLELPPFLDEH